METAADPPPGQRPSSSASSASAASSASTTSYVFDRLAELAARSEKRPGSSPSLPPSRGGDVDLELIQPSDLETGAFLPRSRPEESGRVGSPPRPADRRFRQVAYILLGLLIGAWLISLVVLLATSNPSRGGGGGDLLDSATNPLDALLSGGPSSPAVTLEELRSGFWSPKFQEISWIAGPNREDGLLLSRDMAGKDYLVVEDVTTMTDGSKKMTAAAAQSEKKGKTLIKARQFTYDGRTMRPDRAWPSPDHTKVLIATDEEQNWRHSFTAVYWIFDVATQDAEPLDPADAGARVQLASWSPRSDAIVYTRDNNLFLRRVMSSSSSADGPVHQITADGGPVLFYGVPDWVYEEEVFGANSATWWSADGRHVAFLRTNETAVAEFPLQFFVSRPSGGPAPAGQEAYPDLLKLKYPKAGSANPVVDLRFYDVERAEVFGITHDRDRLPDEDRLITNVLWAGDGQVLVKETNRVSNLLRIGLVDVASRSSRTVRTVDAARLDGGWLEISHQTAFVPADPSNGRPHDGYVDTIIADDGDHLAYFAPLGASEPAAMLTSGPWEVVDAPSAVDLSNNRVYFVGTRESPVQRHVYSVRLDGSDLRPFTNTSAEGYYDVGFSSSAGYALLTYQGPGIPWQMVMSSSFSLSASSSGSGSGSSSGSPSGSSPSPSPSPAPPSPSPSPSPSPPPFSLTIERNSQLRGRAAKHALPELRYGTFEVEPGVELNYLEQRPADFNPARRYPVLFFQYSGPGSQSVDKRFAVTFQSYVASALGYLVVTVDGRGTGLIGRRNRVVVRGHLGRHEAADQIAAGRRWASLPYVDPDRLAIWGWSFGGFTTLKTLELDAGSTFSYGMAVAPVTDWRFYDSVYTERYMGTPQDNPTGYYEAAVTNASALGMSRRFLLVHGTGDDNVHFQNSLALLDRLDLAGVENYDVHVFPDSNHGIYLHNANAMVYDKLANWLINAFNGEWLRVNDAKPKQDKIWT